MFTPDPRQKPQSEHLSHFPGTRSRRPKPALARRAVSAASTRTGVRDPLADKVPYNILEPSS